VIDNSGFANPLDVEAVADRWRYPQSNGTYNGSISRVGLQLKGTFGGEKGAAKGKKGKG
jgi:hypothetical protein